eukprot:Gb_03257 [translate_table: standard]
MDDNYGPKWLCRALSHRYAKRELGDNSRVEEQMAIMPRLTGEFFLKKVQAKNDLRENEAKRTIVVSESSGLCLNSSPQHLGPDHPKQYLRLLLFNDSSKTFGHILSQKIGIVECVPRCSYSRVAGCENAQRCCVSGVAGYPSILSMSRKLENILPIWTSDVKNFSSAWALAVELQLFDNN